MRYFMGKVAFVHSRKLLNDFKLRQILNVQHYSTSAGRGEAGVDDFNSFCGNWCKFIRSSKRVACKATIRKVCRQNSTENLM